MSSNIFPFNPEAGQGQSANKPIVPVARTPMSPAQLDAQRPQAQQPRPGTTITAQTGDGEIAAFAAAWAYQAALPLWIVTRVLQLERRICQLEAQGVAPHLRDREVR